MLVRARRTEFTHVCQNRDPLPVTCGPGQRFQSCHHRVGIGIVGVIDDGDSPGTDNLHSAVRAPECLERPANLAPRHPEGKSHGRSSQGVLSVVPSRNGKGKWQRVLPPPRLKLEPGARLGIQAQAPTAKIKPAAPKPIAHDALEPAGHGNQTRIVSVDEGLRAAHPPETLQQRSLLSRHTVERAEELQMLAPDSGNQPVGGLQYFAQRSDLTRMICADLNDGHLMPALETKRRERNTNVIIQIAFGRQHPVARAQHRRNHLLGRRLAIAPGHGNHWKGKPSTVEPRQLPQGNKRVRHDHQRKTRVPFGDGRHHRADSAAPGSLLQEPVTIKSIPPERHKEITCCNGARVCRNPTDNEARRVLKASSPERSQIVRCQPHASSLMKACTSSWSSKWIF